MLAKAGYSIIYAGPEIGISGDRLLDNIDTQGFTYSPIHFYSPAFKKQGNESELTENQRFENFMFNLMQKDAFGEFINTYQPNLIVLDIFFPYLGIVLFQFEVPIVFASSVMYTAKSEYVPPLNSMAIPSSEKISTGKIKSTWDQYLKQKKKGQAFMKKLEMLSKKHSFPLEKYFIPEKSMVSFGLKFPELIFWPQELDFSRPKSELLQAYYLGGLVDTQRKFQTAFPFPKTSKPIVYCMLGTRSEGKQDRKSQFLLTLIKSMRKINQYYFVVSIGKHLQHLDIKGLDCEHIMLAPFVPQIEVLKRAALMITHGGGDSIKECIRFAVPMLCFPHDNDQYGNSARVQFKQLGITRMMYQEEIKELGDLLYEILHNPVYKQNLQKFQRLFIEAEQSAGAIEIIEGFLGD